MEPRNGLERFLFGLYNVFDVPVTFFREKIVEPNQKKYPWYHKKFRRVPTIDECYLDDFVCVFEANDQYYRDQMVDNKIVSILRYRYDHCLLYHDPEVEKCDDILKTYEEAATNWFIKHGDLGASADVVKAYFKQKHRLVWERRHGPVGTGMKGEDQVSA